MLIEIALFAFVFLQGTITASMIIGMALVICGSLAVQLASRPTGSPRYASLCPDSLSNRYVVRSPKPQYTSLFKTASYDGPT